MRSLCLAAAAMMFAGCASAQTAIERSVIPDASLDFPAFAQTDVASTVQVDNSAWNSFLDMYVAIGGDGVARVDYAGVSEADKETLNEYVSSLENAAPATLNSDEQLAYWINLYNAATVKLILDHYPISSIRSIKSGFFDFNGPWDEDRLTVNGEALSLNDIEHKIIRPIYNEPRIHYAVNCAAAGCPNLRLEAYEGGTIDTALTVQARLFINHPRGVSIDDKGRITASKIFAWYAEDFGASEADTLTHIRQYADPDLAAALAGKTDISNYEYDWALNEQTSE